MNCIRLDQECWFGPPIIQAKSQQQQTYQSQHRYVNSGNTPPIQISPSTADWSDPVRYGSHPNTYYPTSASDISALRDSETSNIPAYPCASSHSSDVSHAPPNYAHSPYSSATSSPHHGSLPSATSSLHSARHPISATDTSTDSSYPPPNKRYIAEGYPSSHRVSPDKIYSILPSPINSDHDVPSGGQIPRATVINNRTDVDHSMLALLPSTPFLSRTPKASPPPLPEQAHSPHIRGKSS